MFHKRKVKSNKHSKNGNNLTLLHLTLNKEIKDSSYNSLAAIVAIITCVALVSISIVGMVFLKPSKRKQKSKK